jgi:GDP-D-mannose dehydratase
MRPIDLKIEKADPTKANVSLKWQAKYKMKELIDLMHED